MQYREASKRRKDFEGKAETDTTQSYDPFNSPNILKMSRMDDPIGCRRALFEDQNHDDVIMPLADNSNLQGLTKVLQMTRQKKRIQPCESRAVRECKTHNKQNHPNEPYSFNQRQRVKFPETPTFKQILKSPMHSFHSAYSQKIQNLKAQIRRKIPITPIDSSSNPLNYHDYGYKYFLCLAQNFRKIYATQEARAMYKIALYIQPYDELAWDWAVKFEEELGETKRALQLAKAGVLFTQSQALAIKYIRLSERQCRPIQEVRGIAYSIASRHQKNSKIYLEIAKLEWKHGNNETAYKLFYYLATYSQNCVNYTAELARFLESVGRQTEAFEALYGAVEKNTKIYQIYSHYLKLVEILCPEHIQEHSSYLARKAQENLPSEVLWKIYLEISQIFFRFNRPLEFRQFSHAALEYAPQNAKWKPYLSISKAYGLDIPSVQNSLLQVELNKDRFVRGKPPNYYAYNEWKHYLHYSLFYLLNKDQKSWQLLEESSTKWSYAGRLWSEILWAERAKNRDVVDKWFRVIMEVPKSGEVWCQGGRIFITRGDIKKALFCLEAAMHLTPQYGDSFIEALKLYMLLGQRQQIQQLKRKLLYCEPFYGNLWCYLKSHPKSSAIDVWKEAKRHLREQLNRSGPLHQQNNSYCLTAIDEYNRLFSGIELSTVEREKIISAYDQLDSSKI